MTTIFRIRRKSDGLFSIGRTYPRFTVKGKAWKQRNHVTSHMTQIGRAWGTGQTKHDYYKDCEVVEYEVIEKEIKAIPALEWDEDPATKKAKQQAADRRAKLELDVLEARKKQLESELAELNKKLA